MCYLNLLLLSLDNNRRFSTNDDYLMHGNVKQNFVEWIGPFLEDLEDPAAGFYINNRDKARLKTLERCAKPGSKLHDKIKYMLETERKVDVEGFFEADVEKMLKYAEGNIKNDKTIKMHELVESTVLLFSTTTVIV